MFNVTKQADYGLFLIYALAKEAGQKPLSLAKISEKYHLPYRFLQKIARKLLQAKIIISEPGKNGGFKLARKPSQINVSQIVAVLDDSLPVKCLMGNCPAAQKCPSRSLWNKILANLNKSMEKITIDQII
ncbi:MAG: hypothetical protein ACD_68C00014G0002 [uncultured bacterium]|nr:MAG: hypothetical protein ACD_68C00014G0002 [uncultured bacterium]